MPSLRLLHPMRRPLAAVCVLAGTFSTCCKAELITIHEGGPTVPIGHYLAALFPQEGLPEAAAATPPASPSLPVGFPVTSPSMQPGQLVRPLRLRTAGWLATPMFVVGDDPLSRQWLVTHRERLQRHRAAGLVVNVGSIESFRALRAIAPELPMAPGSAEGFAQPAGLAVYPLFVAIDGQVTQRVPE
jgi:integrating conjugative element protein (TIGR03765 family)